ncbi:hypothetical protein F3Y22_tig00110059pilonHSYRG00027 [Hibiscus syriacus]|uniref:Uncharacterized protein n=1 Tax=Hibiscus syriacus TaxID=106335 RepID=A0A6A3BMK6_HIBSY|nr:mitochondrial intermembrane space import and assembly protein 40 homolog [Hibiscus syriacus]KAE8717101.1 hypothetical protein F3Y22_tig00110059pilonHSYRG00027 [Hibiscus syriacus]
MGQAQSEVSATDAINDQARTHSPSSMDSILAEAAAYGNDENQSLKAQAQKTLDCPCVAELRDCGAQFTEAFLCLLKSTAEEKDSDCVHPFVALKTCIKGTWSIGPI